MVTSVSQSSIAVAKALPVLDGSRSAMQLSSCWTVAVSGQVSSMVGAVRSNVLIVCVQDSSGRVAVAVHSRHLRTSG